MNLMTVTCVNLKYCYIFYLQKLILHKFNINLSQKLIFPQKEKNESLMLWEDMLPFFAVPNSVRLQQMVEKCP